MNIFDTHICPKQSAEYLYECGEKRGNKMIIENTHLLCMVIWKHDPDYHEKHGLYKPIPAHVNGRFVTWLESGAFNIDWLVIHCKELLRLYGWPNKDHKTAGVLEACEKWFINNKHLFYPVQTDFVHYPGSRDKPDYSAFEIADTHKAYRTYLMRQKLKDPTYKE